MKEYEKILDLDKRINANDKAKKLVKLGCFEQKDVTDINFNDLADLTVDDKLFKGLYRLYEDSTGNLLYIQPLIEADDNGNVHGEATSFDVIYLETMSDETFLKVSHAKRKNSGNIRYIVFFWILLIFLVFLLILDFSALVSSIVTSKDFFAAAQANLFFLLLLDLNIGVFAIYTYLFKKHL